MGRMQLQVAAAMAAIVLGLAGVAAAGGPAGELQAADRLACAFMKGMTAGFTPQGGVTMKPPLDPNTPGLTIDITDRAKGKAILEEDDRETPGVFMTTPMGVTILARDESGNVTLVTVFAQHSGVSDNFPMVSSLHAASLEPRLSQRYGLCRAVEPRGATPPPAPAPAPETGHH